MKKHRQINIRIDETMLSSVNALCKSKKITKTFFFLLAIKHEIINQLNNDDMNKQEFETILERANEIAKPAQVVEQKPTENAASGVEQKQVNEVSKEDFEREIFRLAKQLKSIRDENTLLTAKLDAANGEIKERIRKEIHLSPQANEIINILAKRSGKTTGEIISKYIEDYNLAKFTAWFHPWILTSEEEAYFINQIEADETRQTRIGEVVFND